MVLTGHRVAKAASVAIAKLLGAGSGRDGAEAVSPGICPTAMLTQSERDAVLSRRARAASELQSIREEGLLGRHWRNHPRTLFLLGYLSGTNHRIDIDNAARN